MKLPIAADVSAILRQGLAAAIFLGATGVQAQFAMVPPSALQADPPASQAADEREYRKDAARHLYAAFPSRIYKGKLPPLMYAVMITDTELDATGQVQKVTVVRPPAAATEVTPWVVSLIRRASPFPAPTRLGEKAVYREIWLVDRSGRFQVDTLTEGQP
ncbi:MAG: hypothetical protein ACOYLV_04705 [Rubrivivax sp.]